ncbi:hypothetical protein [Photobacterium atrarenae]|uniref:PRD domain-containing protein n=1 Tax=Photobacterium atrarenae TaxID=865757 RepID=A0ABY5GM59_9GAMM|nr:hypothetical protein [Photobacterium atrarenae]UTV30395.1 hypothetical protein NNL38_17615 [Photobacterium atrarenae]
MKERLNLLRQANVISADACQATEIAVRLIGEQFALTPDNEQFQMAMTHFARAFDRIRSGAPVDEGLDPEIFDEILADDGFEQVQALNQRILDQVGLVQVPVTENSFFLSNLFSLCCASAAEEGTC